MAKTKKNKVVELEAPTTETPAPLSAIMYPLPVLNENIASEADKAAFAPLYADWRACVDKSGYLYPAESLIRLVMFVADKTANDYLKSDYYINNYIKHCNTGGRSGQAFKFVEQHLHKWGLIDFSIPELKRQYAAMLEAKNAKNG